ncbi:chloride channel protein [Parapedobacter pyrenivorans]|uniref:Chloride channel protein n=1 Tax=Parapedobacter pyrenivorans TaxID=1305674 RepID=A0A917HN90_9SPHI|nr:chloride channel protein [Parapedobacter pyrenivorans]GGG85113.1 chloride channel protein [Parapedobacter pyrenivorans]
MASKHQAGIPISMSLKDTLKSEGIVSSGTPNKIRIVIIAAYAVCIAAAISLIAKLLVLFINIITNLSFYGVLSVEEAGPWANSLGVWVIIIPAIGGLIVGVMALYGSKAIRGHGIPEAMEQVLTNQSKIRPSITYLKPISSAIAIGTGGPFGAEGPIIATGGALGSTLGQLLNISHSERKILLAAGATAGMTAIFGSPVAAIFLAIELLLFEFTPKSLIAVSLACITGAAGHHFLFSTSPVFLLDHVIPTASNSAILSYSVIGLAIGFLSIGITKAVYWVEDAFEHLPFHWMWWPAIGGLGVGIVGYFAPRTLGVGYENITDLLNNNLPLTLVLSLCLLKFLSWVIALGSGTSGGTLAPLLTIGAATGLLGGKLLLLLFPECGVNLTLAALVGMSAMFSGASRAVLTSIVFALETTGQFNAMLPLLGSCVGAYLVSYLFMDTTIMTEKITRRGIHTPDSYQPDQLHQLNVGQAIEQTSTVIEGHNTVEELRNWSKAEGLTDNYYIVVDSDYQYIGIVSASSLFAHHQDPGKVVKSLIKRQPAYLKATNSLKEAISKMASENVDVLPVLSATGNTVVGLLHYKNILAAYHAADIQNEQRGTNISIKRSGMRMLVKGKKILIKKRNN